MIINMRIVKGKQSFEIFDNSLIKRAFYNNFVDDYVSWWCIIFFWRNL